MKPNTRIAIASLLHSAGKVLSALAFEFGGTEAVGEPETQSNPATAATLEQPVKTRKPREPKVEKPAEPEPVTEPVVPATNGKTYDDMKAVIDPLVKEGRGAEVKAAITKYSPTLKEMDPSNYAAFEKDIEALSY